MKKRLFSLLTGGVLIAGMTAPTVSAADNAELVPIDDCGYFSAYDTAYGAHEVLAAEDSADTFVIAKCAWSEIQLTSADTGSISALLAAHTFADGMEYACGLTADGKTAVILSADGNVSAAAAKEIRDILRNSGISPEEFTYMTDRKTFTQGVTDGAFRYDEADTEAVAAYLADSQSGCVLADGELVFHDNTGIREKLSVVFGICGETGIRCSSGFGELWDTGQGSACGIDLSRSVDGDANCDDSTDIADAVKVLQYIANSEKYPMTAQGLFNADIDGEAGITGADAIAIQSIDAGVWEG